MSSEPALAVDFDDPPRGVQIQLPGLTPAESATQRIATTLKNAGIDAPCSLYNEALALARDGHLGQAMQRLQMLLCLDPDDAEALLLSAKVQAAQGRPAEALARLDQAVAAGALPPAGFRDYLEAAIRAERAREEERRARVTSREQGELKALRNEARQLRTENVRLETEVGAVVARERAWKWTALIASTLGILAVGLALASGARDGAEAPAAVAAAPVPAEVETAPAVPAPVPAGVETAPAVPAGEATPAPERRTHVVRSGDTLYKLAARYYGDASKWESIRDANRATLGNGIALQLGQELVIP